MERAVICGYFDSSQGDGQIHAILEEMKALAESAGAEAIGLFPQRRPVPDRRFLIGMGKAEEIRLWALEERANLIVFYNVLSAMQQRNLEDFFKIKVIDRTRLILDIFAQRARSMEGKLQVELAQNLYLLPRLTGKGVALSRLGGGIGTRGPGESKLESDRRLIKKRISLIRRRLQDVMASREQQRKKRRDSPVPVVSLVGYTSSGKSTLFRTLTGESVAISPQLFSTLDPLLRRVSLDPFQPGCTLLLSDTVGFIRSMPPELFTSFQATLEEVSLADLVLHLVDISTPDYRQRQEEVERVLDQMGIPANRVMTVFNKIDLLPNPEEDGRAESDDSAESDSPLRISAERGWGIESLKARLFSRLFSDFSTCSLSIPADTYNPESLSHWAVILSQSSSDGMVRVDIFCSRENMIKFSGQHGGDPR